MTATVNDSPSAAELRGSTTPAYFTPPLVVGPPGPCGCGCALTDETTVGFAVVEWATVVLHHPPEPWQRWALIHGLELLPDGRPRFRVLLIEVARQNGKTTLLTILALWWQFVVCVGMVLGTSTKLEYAKESWRDSVLLAEAAPALSAQRARRWTRDTNGEQESWTTSRSRYKIAASNEEGGRSLRVDRLILDELRQHHSYVAWAAAVNAGRARRNFQAWCLSNAGTDRSVVLNDLHASVLTMIRWADAVGVDQVLELKHDAPGDIRTGGFLWVCDVDADPLDPGQLAIANPSLGYHIELDDLIGDAKTAVNAGGEALAKFKTESMCIRVPSLNLAVDLAAWGRSEEPATLDTERDRIAACLDVSPDGGRADLVVAALLDDDRVRVEVVKSWDSLADVRRELPAWLDRVKPYAFGWFPRSGAAALVAELGSPKAGRLNWPPRGVQVAEIKTEAPAVCMGFAALVGERRVIHSGQDSLTTHMGNAEKAVTGPVWVFDRRPGGGHVTGAYATAGAVHLARTIPAPVRRSGFRVAR